MSQNNNKKDGQNSKQQNEGILHGPSNMRLQEYFTNLNDEHRGQEYDKLTQNLVIEVTKKLDEDLKKNKIKISEKSEDLTNVMTFNYKGQKWEDKTRDFKLKEAQKMKKELEQKLNQIDSNIDVLEKTKESKFKNQNKEDVYKRNSLQANQEENKEQLDKFVENIILERRELEKRRKQRVQGMLDDMKKQEQMIKEKEQKNLEDQLHQRRQQIEKNLEKYQERQQNREKEKEKFIQELKDIQKSMPLFKKKEIEDHKKAKQQEKEIQQKLLEQKEKYKPINQEEIQQHIQKDKEIQQERQARQKNEQENLRKQLKDYLRKYEGSTEKYQEMKAEYMKLISSADTRKQHFEEIKQKKQDLQEKIKKKWENPEFIDENKKSELQKKIEYENIPMKQKIKVLKAHENTYDYKEDKFKLKELNKSALPESEYGGVYQIRDELDYKQQREKGKEYMKEINAINTEKYQKRKDYILSSNGLNTPQPHTKSVPKKDLKNISQSTISKALGGTNVNDSLIKEAEKTENAIRRSKMIESGNLNMIQAKQVLAYKHDKVDQWEEVLKDEKLTEQEKKQRVIEHAKKLENKAIRQEQLNKVKGKDEIKDHEAEEIDDLIVNSIKAKLAFIKQ